MPHTPSAILKAWIAETVRPVASDSVDQEAERLALEFRAYAGDAGLKPERLEDEFGETLPDIMRDALRDAAGGSAAAPADTDADPLP